MRRGRAAFRTAAFIAMRLMPPTPLPLMQGNQNWLTAMAWGGQQGFARAQYSSWGAGTYKSYGNLMFVRVDQAGHMVRAGFNTTAAIPAHAVAAAWPLTLAVLGPSPLSMQVPMDQPAAAQALVRAWISRQLPPAAVRNRHV